MKKEKVVIFWFRRDLRLYDNAALHHALQSGFPVLPIFIFDETILRQSDNRKDRRVDYFHQALETINETLKTQQSALCTFHGKPLEVFKMLHETYDVEAVFCNRDYEPTAIKRDIEIYTFFKATNIPFKAFKDQVIFDKSDILKSDGKAYTVYSAYARRWRERLQEKDYRPYPTGFNGFFPQSPSAIISLEEIGFEQTEMRFEKPVLDADIIDQYEKFRDYPALNGTTRLGIALRFGTISIRQCVGFALMHSQTWLSELIWREFFMQILYHFPSVVHHSFKPNYDGIEWRNEESEFQKWCDGMTGYPIVDAGMRQLNETGYMHNRVRMVAASFLCKHLLIDWRWGEAWFAEKLNDYELSSNNGNWQWAAGSGCDAAPYFRIFNPATQAQKFDKNLEYVKRWIPEWGTQSYPPPMVDHSFARERALKAYSRAINNVTATTGKI